MKSKATIFIVLVCLFIPQQSCRFTKKSQRSKSSTSIDSSYKKTIDTSAINITRDVKTDNVKVADKSMYEKIEVSRPVVTSGNSFKLSGNFKTAPAGADTFRLSSDAVSFEWYYDSAKRDHVVQIVGKKRDEVIGFEEIRINRATLNKDSNFMQKTANEIFTEMKKKEDTETVLQRKEARTEILKQVQKSKTPAWILWPVIITVVAGLIYLLLKKIKLL